MVFSKKMIMCIRKVTWEGRNGEDWFFKRKTYIEGPFLMGEASFQIPYPNLILWKKKIMLFNWILSLYSKLNCSKEEKSAFNSKIGKLAEKMDLQLVLWSECLNEKLETYTLSSQKQNG